MELKLENNLPHQTAPVEGVAAIVEASIQEPAKASHQNPLLKNQLSGEALHAVRQKVNILDKVTKHRITHYMLPDKIKALPHHRILDIKMETGTGKTSIPEPSLNYTSVAVSTSLSLLFQPCLSRPVLHLLSANQR